MCLNLVCKIVCICCFLEVFGVEKFREIGFIIFFRKSGNFRGRRSRFYKINKIGYILGFLGGLCFGWILKGMVVLVYVWGVGLMVLIICDLYMLLMCRE